VIGDIVNLISPQLSFIPADLFLLTGDTIVNESMLTGESVPVSKIPARSEDIAQWKDSDDVGREIAKSFLYCGTRVVRTRGSLAPDGSTRNPAVGLVTRTGTRRLIVQVELRYAC
jgi:cation-transporting ATPase 13A2